jgi:PhzF family phenazine biosynthesis protein
MVLPIHQVDAFTGKLFGGNPAAVVLLDEPLPEKTMQSIAAENNLAETAFVVKGGHEHGLRWFTPTVEMDLCGHATLASAHVLFRHGYARRSPITFRYGAGTLSVAQEGDLLAMDFPSRPPEPDTPGSPLAAALTAALGAAPQQVLRARDLMAVFETQQEVEALRPDFAALLRIDSIGVIVTAPGKEVDFVSRFFAPRVGVPEDPVTGSAHCTLIPYWSRRLGRKKLHALQVSPRGGELFLADQGDRVSIAGRAVEYLRGTITI